jgi:hypothetical protein
MKLLIKILILWVFVLVGCKKEINKPYFFTGKVLDNFGNGIAKAKVQLLVYYPATNAIFNNGGYSTLVNTTTDNLGNFESKFTYDTISAQSFLVMASATNYYGYQTDDIIPVWDGSTFRHNVIMNKESKIKIVFKNIPPSSNEDVLTFGHSSGGALIKRELTSGIYDSNFQEYVGNNVEGYELSTTKGDKFTKVGWLVRNNGIIHEFIDSIFIVGGSEGTFILNY